MDVKQVLGHGVRIYLHCLIPFHAVWLLDIESREQSDAQVFQSITY